MRRALLFLAGAALVGALAIAVVLPGIHDQPFYTKGEPREAMVAWEMAHGGGLVLPYRNGTEIPSKPPLYHWLALAASRATGSVSEFSARLPSALLSIVAVVAVYAFGAWGSRLRSGGLAAISLALSFEWLRAARSARVDMTLTFFLAGALLLFGIMDRAGVTRARLALFYLFVAAATLGKGPVGIALPALVVLVYLAIRPAHDPDSLIGAPAGGGHPIGSVRPGFAGRVSRVLGGLRALRPEWGIPAVLLIAGAWYAAAVRIGGDDFVTRQVLRENVFRVIDPERLDSGHVHGPLYLLPGFLLGALPWSLLAPAIAWWIWSMRPVDATTRYLLVWFLCVIGFFTIPPSKRTVYVLPAYPAAALLFGRILGPGPEGAGPRRLAGLGMAAGGMAIAAIGLAALVVASGMPIASWIGPRLEAHDAQGLTAAVASLMSRREIAVGGALAAVLGSLLAAREARGAHWLRGTALLGAAIVALFGSVILPVERSIADSRALDAFMRAVRLRAGDEKLGFLCAYDYGAVFYSQRYFRDDGRPRCDGGRSGGRCRDHVQEVLDEAGCADPARRAAALRAPGTPRYLLAWEDLARDMAGQVDILLLSEGSGPKGRARMALVTPTGAATGVALEPVAEPARPGRAPATMPAPPVEPAPASPVPAIAPEPVVEPAPANPGAKIAPGFTARAPDAPARAVESQPPEAVGEAPVPAAPDAGAGDEGPIRHPGEGD